MSEAELQLDNNCIKLQGVCTYDTATALLNEAYKLIDQVEGDVIFDFSGVTQFNSVALALLVAWARYSKVQSKNFACQGLPEQLLKIAEVYNLNEAITLPGLGD